MSVRNDRRQYFRIKLNNPLCARMSIVQIGKRKIKTGSTQVCIKNIGPGGICFLSNLKLPVDPNIILEFETQILGESILLHGCIVRTRKIVEDMFEYGVWFDMDELMRSRLIKLFNDLSIQLRKKVILGKCNFCAGNCTTIIGQKYQYKYI